MPKLGFGIGINRDQGVRYLPETLAYRNRIETDPSGVGEISDENLLLVDATIKFLKSSGLWDKLEDMWISYGGLRTEGTDPVKVNKVYGIKGNDDLTNAIATEQPYLDTSGEVPLIEFNGVGSKLVCTFSEPIDAPHYRGASVKVYNSTNAFLFAGSDTYACLYRWDGVDMRHRDLSSKTLPNEVRDNSLFLALFDANLSTVFRNNLNLDLVGYPLTVVKVNGYCWGNRQIGSYPLGTSNVAYQFKSAETLSKTEITALFTHFNPALGLQALEV